MTATIYRGRRAVTVENEQLRVTVLLEGGHIAEIYDKETGVSPLWTPPWDSIEPSSYDARKHPEYGEDAEAKLLAGIMGHNLCLDIFGGPSADETALGLTVHGEGSVVTYEISEIDGGLLMKASLPLSQIHFERRIELYGRAVRVRESVESRAAWDRPIAWTQHVTLGPPFLKNGKTQLRASMTRSKVFEKSFGPDMLLKPGAEFAWPMAPLNAGGEVDLRTFTNAAASTDFTTHLADPHQENAFFIAYTPEYKQAFGYIWKRADFPWLGIWQENNSRKSTPWSGRTLTLGMEFGVSPIPESRRAMVERGSLFDVPTFRWLPAMGRSQAEYCVVTQKTDQIPDELEWPN